MIIILILLCCGRLHTLMTFAIGGRSFELIHVAKEREKRGMEKERERERTL